ncbi:MAG: sulfite exporter TauE/SafE family protein, partial [Clostridia bacterium]|nr:sulfite exporter TauE/SafE family protein [Clostridia bacterium]
MPSAIVFFIAMTGAAVQAVTGFGYGILVMAVLPLFLPMEQAVMVSTMTSM